MKILTGDMSTTSYILKISDTIDVIEARIKSLDVRTTILPLFEYNGKDQTDYGKTVLNFDLFGRLRTDMDTNLLAGIAPIPPIFRPIEMTLVPEKVTSFGEVAMAMRHALHLCVLLSNQQAIVRNSYTLRVCLLG